MWLPQHGIWFIFKPREYSSGYNGKKNPTFELRKQLAYHAQQPAVLRQLLSLPIVRLRYLGEGMDEQ